MTDEKKKKGISVTMLGGEVPQDPGGQLLAMLQEAMAGAGKHKAECRAFHFPEPIRAMLNVEALTNGCFRLFSASDPVRYLSRQYLTDTLVALETAKGENEHAARVDAILRPVLLALRDALSASLTGPHAPPPGVEDPDTSGTSTMQ